MTQIATGHAPGHRIRRGASAAAVAVAVAVATLVGLTLHSARPRAPTLVEGVHPSLPAGEAPTGGDPGRLSGGQPAGPTGSAGAAPTVDLSGLRALPPAGSGGPGTETQVREPTVLRIPSLEIDGAPVVPVGLDADGALEVPGAHEVGWYRLGARPGAGAGSIVLAAHVAYDGEDGVFRRLGSLAPGAAVTVEAPGGGRLSYRVDTVAVHRKADLPIDDLFNPSSPERLVLITCGGRFNPQLHHYDSNVVAIATPAPDP